MDFGEEVMNLEFKEEPFYSKLKHLLETNLMKDNHGYNRYIDLRENSNMGQINDVILRECSNTSNNQIEDTYIDDPARENVDNKIKYYNLLY